MREALRADQARSRMFSPALLIRMSSRPNFFPIRWAVASTAALSTTSSISIAALPPAAAMRRAVSSSGALRRPDSTTSQPALARAIAVARPIPLPAPVTHATLPWIDDICLLLKTFALRDALRRDGGRNLRGVCPDRQRGAIGTCPKQRAAVRDPDSRKARNVMPAHRPLRKGRSNRAQDGLDGVSGRLAAGCDFCGVEPSFFRLRSRPR